LLSYEAQDRLAVAIAAALSRYQLAMTALRRVV
jgi:hypothetical protein